MSEANATPTSDATKTAQADEINTEQTTADKLNDIQATAEQATAEPASVEPASGEPEAKDQADVILDPAEAEISFDEILNTTEETTEESNNPENIETTNATEAEDTATIDVLPSIADLQAQISDLSDKLLRATAETENVRRRAVRDREEASKFAISRFAKEMLSVADNMKRALDTGKIETGKVDEPEEPVSLDTLQGQYNNLIAGLKISESEMLKTFEQIGIKQIDAAGQLFDPNLHEALFEMPDPSVRAGTIMQILEYGYTLNGRLLRPAKVGISKGGPREAPASEGEPGSQIDQEF